MIKRFLLLLAIIMSFASCTREHNSDVLSIAVSSEPSTLDMAVNTALIGRIISVGNIYEKLFVLDSKGNVRCELASGYELSEDGRNLDVEIRRGVVFHDGSELDSEDVVLSMNRWLESYTAADSLTGGARFESSGENTVTIKSEKPLSLFPYLIAASPQSAVIMPSESILGEREDGLITEAIGTGPYKLSEWRSGEFIELERFDGYVSCNDVSDGVWGKKSAEIKRLRYYFVSDSVTRRLGLENGQYQFINDVMSDDIPAFSSNPEIILEEGGESGLIALVFNKKSGLGRDLDFRRGISAALDKDNLMRSCYGDYGYSLHQDYMEIEQSMWISGEDNPYGKHDIAEAAKLLDSYEGETVKILTSNLSNLDKIAIAAGSDIKKAGLSTEIISVDWASMVERRRDPESWDIYISAFSQVPLPQLKSFLSPTFPGWTDEEIYNMTLSLNDVESLDEAALKWRELEKEIWAYVPAVIAGHYSTVYAHSSALDGIICQNGFYFWNATFN